MVNTTTLTLAKNYANKLIKDAGFQHYTPVVGEVKVVDSEDAAAVSITWDDKKKIETFSFAFPRGKGGNEESADITYADTQELLDYYNWLKVEVKA